MMEELQPFRHMTQNTALNQALRKHFADVSASDVARAIGGHPHQTPYGLYEERRLGRAKEPSSVGKRMMEHGQLMEPLILEAVARLFFPGTVNPRGMFVKVQLTERYFLTATPDARAFVDNFRTGCVIECKAACPGSPDSVEDVAKLVDYHVPQLLCQMYCTGYNTAYYCRHNGRDSIAVYRCAFDGTFWRTIQGHVEKFLTQCRSDSVPQRRTNGTIRMWRQAYSEYIAAHCTLVTTVLLNHDFSLQ